MKKYVKINKAKPSFQKSWIRLCVLAACVWIDSNWLGFLVCNLPTQWLGVVEANSFS